MTPKGHSMSSAMVSTGRKYASSNYWVCIEPCLYIALFMQYCQLLRLPVFEFGYNNNIVF